MLKFNGGYGAIVCDTCTFTMHSGPGAFDAGDGVDFCCDRCEHAYMGPNDYDSRGPMDLGNNDDDLEIA